MHFGALWACVRRNHAWNEFLHWNGHDSNAIEISGCIFHKFRGPIMLGSRFYAWPGGASAHWHPINTNSGVANCEVGGTCVRDLLIAGHLDYSILFWKHALEYRRNRSIHAFIHGPSTKGGAVPNRNLIFRSIFPTTPKPPLLAEGNFGHWLWINGFVYLKILIMH